MKCVGTYLIARFLERPNKFLARVILESSEKIEFAHVPDPGRLKELLIPNAQVILKKSASSKRKTKYSLIGVKTKSSITDEEIWVNIDSIISNRLFKEEFHLIPSLKHYLIMKSEFVFRNSRFDFLMKSKKPSSKRQILTEIKSVTLVKNGVALFPDAPTLRGLKHLKELTHSLDSNYSAILVFMIKRCDVISFSPNKEIDPSFTAALVSAVQHGIKLYAIKCSFDPIIDNELKIIEQIPIYLLNKNL